MYYDERLKEINKLIILARRIIYSLNNRKKRLKIVHIILREINNSHSFKNENSDVIQRYMVSYLQTYSR